MPKNRKNTRSRSAPLVGLLEYGQWILVVKGGAPARTDAHRRGLSYRCGATGCPRKPRLRQMDGNGERLRQSRITGVCAICDEIENRRRAIAATARGVLVSRIPYSSVGAMYIPRSMTQPPTLCPRYLSQCPVYSLKHNRLEARRKIFFIQVEVYKYPVQIFLCQCDWICFSAAEEPQETVFVCSTQRSYLELRALSAPRSHVPKC
ncbi:hypothetical protein DFH06DRAFT_1123732 [Mycena polygramma]|nr:hypothetical protein DFH06DRAFT_1123732 [Mycena polygramma]